MTAVQFIWLQLAVCAGLIGAAGYQLSRCGDTIARRTGLSGSRIGLPFVATDLARAMGLGLLAMYLLNTYVLYLHGE